MDAITIINLSLIEGSIETNGMLEGFINEEGEFEVMEIGHNNGSLDPIYYELQTSSYKESCTGVMITGSKPRLSRKDLIWKPIWGESKVVYDSTDIIANCSLDDFSTNALIVFNDPHLDTKYEDGINNFYELTEENPWDRVVGYSKYISVPGYDKKQLNDTSINYHKTSKVPIICGVVEGDEDGPSLGTLLNRPIYSGNDTPASSNVNCWKNTGEVVGSYSDGIKIPFDKGFFYEDVRGEVMSKFMSVEAVYVVGYKFDWIYSIPADPEQAREEQTESNTDLIGYISDTVKNTFKLEEGTHYSIMFSPEGEEASGFDNNGFKEPYIVFAKNTRINEPKKFGSKQKYYLSTQCELAQSDFGGGDHIGTILPVAFTKGFLVEQILAVVNIDTPSISVYDPELNDQEGDTKAIDIAHALEYQMAPIIVTEPPAPIAFCEGGRASIVDQASTLKDNDPTTKQNFTDTELEIISDKMSSGPGVNLTLSFIEEEEDLLNLSERFFNYMNAASSGAIEKTYVCGPEADPKLGALIYDGVVNEINYSYNDSGSYTISVNEGPTLVGNLTSVNTSASFKVSESVSARGTVIDDIGDGIFFKVKLDGYAERIAINTAPNIIRIGDTVSCTIHNNPVET